MTTPPPPLPAQDPEAIDPAIARSNTRLGLLLGALCLVITGVMMIKWSIAGLPPERKQYLMYEQARSQRPADDPAAAAPAAVPPAPAAAGANPRPAQTP